MPPTDPLENCADGLHYATFASSASGTSRCETALVRPDNVGGLLDALNMLQQPLQQSP